MDISIFKKSNTKQEKLSAVEAFNIWDILRARYNSLETLQLYDNFIHDRDFSYIMNKMINDYKNQINKLEEFSKKFKLKVPSSPAQDVRISTQIDQLTDKYIYKKVFSDLIYELYSLNRGLVTTTFNDNLREFFVKFILSHFKNYENLYKYGKLKGWTEIAPSFKTGKPVEKEEVSVSEASHLWDHLNLRYDQLQLTMVFLQFAHDTEFKKILEKGKTRLEEQIKYLEEKCNEYEIPKPERPPAVNEAAVDPEIIEDKFAYRNIFQGIQGAINLHIRAIVETLTNDNLRETFLNYFKEEANLFDKFLKYGKMKGWTHIPPTYKQL